jgi:hypothetical protein
LEPIRKVAKTNPAIPVKELFQIRVGFTRFLTNLLVPILLVPILLVPILLVPILLVPMSINSEPSLD